MSALVDAVLVLLVLAVALVSVLSRQARTAVIGFIALGPLLALAWVRLGAVDVALTEAAIAALSGPLLLAASAVLGEAKPASLPLRLALGTLCALLAGALAIIVLDAPDAAPSLAADAVAPLGALNLGNPVTAVLLAYRALDTLLETIVVVLALVGIWSLADDANWLGASATPASPSPPLDLLARVLPPVGLVVAVHLLWVGADAPGGKFQAATVMAAMGLLVLMAGLALPPPLGGKGVRVLVVAGPAVFLAIGLTGFAVSGHFLAYPDGWAKPLIVVIEVALALSVALTLMLIVLGPGTRKPPA